MAGRLGSPVQDAMRVGNVTFPSQAHDPQSGGHGTATWSNFRRSAMTLVTAYGWAGDRVYALRRELFPESGYLRTS
jgi:hypothetical protein